MIERIEKVEYKVTIKSKSAAYAINDVIIEHKSELELVKIDILALPANGEFRTSNKRLAEAIEDMEKINEVWKERYISLGKRLEDMEEEIAYVIYKDKEEKAE